MSPNNTTNGKLDPSRAKIVIAAGSFTLALQEHTKKAPRWMNRHKITQKQKLAKVATNKKDCVEVVNSGGMRSKRA